MKRSPPPGSICPGGGKVRNVKLFFYLCAFLLLTWSSAVAATPTLTLGGATVDATGTMVTIPVILTNVTGRSISGVETHVRFNNVSDVFALKMSGASVISATPGPVATAAGKQLSEGSQAYGDLHLIIYGGSSVIASGVIANIAFDIAGPVTAANETFSLGTTTATDPTGSSVSISAVSVVAVPPSSLLSVSVSSNGTVYSAPSGIVCLTGTCAAAYFTNSVVSLLPIASNNYDLNAWSGDCTLHGACKVTMSTNRTVTATFLLNNHVQILGVEKNTLNNAYISAVNGSILYASDYKFIENLTLNRTPGLAITLTGGWNMWFDRQLGDTIIKGALRVATGSLVADHLIIQ